MKELIRRTKGRNRSKSHLLADVLILTLIFCFSIAMVAIVDLFINFRIW